MEILINQVSLRSSLNVSGSATLSNHTTWSPSLNVSSNSIFSNNITVLSLLNVSWRTIIGSNICNYSDSILEAHKNFSIRNNITSGSRVDMEAGSSAYCISLQDGTGIFIETPTEITTNYATDFA